MTYQEIVDLENEINKQAKYKEVVIHDHIREQFDDHVDNGLELGYSLKDTIAAILYEDECGCK